LYNAGVFSDLQMQDYHAVCLVHESFG